MAKKLVSLTCILLMLASMLPTGVMADTVYHDDSDMVGASTILATNTYQLTYSGTTTDLAVTSSYNNARPVVHQTKAALYKVAVPQIPEGKILDMAQFRASSYATTARAVQYAYKFPENLDITTLTIGQAATYINSANYASGAYYIGSCIEDAANANGSQYRNRYDVKDYINECVAAGQQYFWIAITRSGTSATAYDHTTGTAYWQPKLFYKLKDAPALELETTSPSDGAQDVAPSLTSVSFEFSNDIDSAAASVNGTSTDNVTVGSDGVVCIGCTLEENAQYEVSVTATDIYKQTSTKTICFTTARDIDAPSLSVNGSSYCIKSGDDYFNYTADSVSSEISLANNGAVFYKLELPSVASGKYLSSYTLTLQLDAADDASAIKAYAIPSDGYSYDNLYIIDAADLSSNAGKTNVDDILKDHNANSAGMVVADGSKLTVELTALARQRIENDGSYMTIALTSDSAGAKYCMDNAQLRAEIENNPKISTYSAATEVYGCQLLSAQFGVYTDLSDEYVVIMDGENEVDSAAFAYNGYTNRIELCDSVILDENTSYTIVIKSGAADSYGNTASDNIVVTSFTTGEYIPLSEEDRAQLWRDLVSSSDAEFIESKWSLCVQCFGFKTEALAAVSDNIDLFAKRLASHADRATYASNYPEYSKDNAAVLCGFYDSIASALATELELLASISNVSHSSQISKIITSDGNAAILGITDLVASYKSLYSTDSVDTAVMNAIFREAKDFRLVFAPALTKALENNTKPHTGIVLGDTASTGSSSPASGAIGNFTPVPETTEPVQKPMFSDIDGYGWAKAQIEYLCSKGIVSGRAEGVFAPSDKITRAEFITMIVNTFGIKNTSAECSFDDVSQSDWFHNYVASGVENGIILGNGASFMPNSNITRQDMAVIVARACENSGKALSGTADFSDTALFADYAKDAVSALAGTGIISGFPDGSFAPMENLTRAQAAVVIYNIITKIL